MTRRYAGRVVIGATITLIAVAACKNPLAGSSGAAPRSKTAISVNIRPVAPVVGGLMQKLGVQSLRTIKASGRYVPASLTGARSILRRSLAGVAPKAYIAADRIHFTLFNASNQEITTWDASPGADAYTSISLSVSQLVPAGTYFLQADIYNNQTSTTSPMVSGSASMTVTPDQTTSVTISCLPTSAQMLTVAGGPGTAALPPWLISLSGNGTASVASPGAETWYQVSLISGTTYSVPVTSSTGGSDAYAFVFDASGDFVAAGGAGTYGFGPAVFTASSTGTFYIGTIGFQTVAGASPVQVSTSVEIAPAAPVLTMQTVFPNYDLVDQSVHMIWNAPQNGETFRVLRSTDPSFATWTNVTTGTGANSLMNGYSWNGESLFWDFFDHTAAYNQTYYYEVASITTATGAQSSFSNPVTATAAPVGLTALSNTTTGNIDVSWTAANGALYSVELLDSKGASLVVDNSPPAGSDSFAYSPNSGQPTVGSQYYVHVEAYTPLKGNGYWSITGPVTYLGLPVSSITVAGSGAVTSIGYLSSVQMIATVLPANSNPAVTWSVMDAKGGPATNANIDASGVLHGGGNSNISETVTVTATAQDGSGVSGQTSINISAG